MTFPSEPVRVTASLEQLRTLADGSLRMTFDTPEIAGEKVGQLHDLRKQYGHLIFCPNGTKEVELPTQHSKGIPDPPNMKKRSVKLRAILFRYWEKLGKPGDSEKFYNREMDQIIESYIEKLE